MEHEDQRLMHAARFSFFAFGFLLFWWFSYFLAISGFFSVRLLALFGLIMGSGAFMAARKWISQETPTAKILAGAAMVFAAALLFFAEPTIFSGRDQGSISEAAIELAHTGTIPFSSSPSDTFFGVYGEGKSLNFPGFFYTDDGKLKTQFPIGYTVWTAAWTTFFGIDGFRIGNGILLAFSILTIFLLVRVLANEWYAIGATTIFATSFLPTWFAKFTLSENAALFLFLFLSLHLVLFLRESRFSFFLGAYFSALMLAVTRIEGIWVLGVTLAILFLSRQGRAFTKSNTTLFRNAPTFFAFLVVLINFTISVPFYTMIAKAIFKNLSSVTQINQATFANSAEISFSLWKLFAVYGSLPIFLFGFAGIFFLLRKRRMTLLIPALLAFPTFLYFVDPNITHDHPWMLRRFLPFVFPALLLSATLALSVFAKQKKQLRNAVAILVYSSVLLIGVPASVRTFTFADNRGLLKTTAEIATTVGERDLLLIDRGTTGDPFAIPAGPLRFLHNRNAVYFFNPKDYERISKDRYDRIYLLTPLERFEEWKQMPVSFEFVSTFTFSTKRLEPVPLKDIRFPNMKRTDQTAVLFELKSL